MVKVKLVPPPTPMAAAPNVLRMVGEPVVGAVGSTVREVVEVFPVPPLLEVTVALLLYVPGETPVTFIEKVHELPPDKVAPARETVCEPATAVIVPPSELPVRPLGVETTKPAGNVSVKAIPVSATVAFGLVMAKVFVVDPPTPMAAAPNVSTIEGCATKLALQAVSETSLLSRVTAPFCARTLPDTVAPVVKVMLVNAEVPGERGSGAERCGTSDLPEHIAGRSAIDDVHRRVAGSGQSTAIWKTKTAFGLPWASSVGVPVN